MRPTPMVTGSWQGRPSRSSICAAVGAILVTGSADSPLTIILGLIAIVLATINLVGGFVVTDRMLEMFKPRKSVANDTDGGSL